VMTKRKMRTPSPFLVRLQQRPVLGDGGMGIQLYARGISYEQCLETLNLTDPELIKTIHLEYVAAGADIIETNTFGANRYRLAAHGLAQKVRDVNRAGAKLAREVRELSELPLFLAGNISPLGSPLTPLGSIRPADARDAFLEQTEALLQTGVDLFIIETIMDLAEMREALMAVRAVTDLPVVATLSCGEDGMVASGEDPLIVARVLHELSADVVGVNCALGPSSTLSVMEAMCVNAPNHPFFAAQPNAGLPQRVGGRCIYMSSPEYFAVYARHLLEVGVRLIGGCCGTTPQHSAAMHQVLSEFALGVSVQAKPAETVPRLETVRERGIRACQKRNLCLK
jgi:methionine synthase / methylenetetrahydrofolate reductase(NADPH)